MSRHLALFSIKDARAYPFVFQRFSEPISITTSVAKQPIGLGQTTNHRPRASAITHLACGEEQVQRSTLAVANGVQLRVHAALGAAIQTVTPPF